VWGLVEPSGEISLVPGNLLQRLIIRQQPFPTYPLEIPRSTCSTACSLPMMLILAASVVTSNSSSGPSSSVAMAMASMPTRTAPAAQPP
jgi:hypothetical protein